ISTRSSPATRRSHQASARTSAGRCSTTTPSGSTGSMPERIGYVGVGLMGGPMVRRLLGRGHVVRAYDIAPERLREAAAAGAAPAGAAGDVVEGAGIVALNLPTPQAVEEAVFGADGVA